MPRAIKHAPPSLDAIVVRYVRLPTSHRVKAAIGIAALIRVGGTTDHNEVADEIVSGVHASHYRKQRSA